MANIALEINVDEVVALAEEVGGKLTVEQFDRLMYRTMREIGTKMKTIITKEIRKHYQADYGWVQSAIHAPEITGGGGSYQCLVPVIGEKGKIGGQFSAGGGAYGWNPPPYQVTAKILKGSTSVLPSTMASYGGQPPFRNIGSSRKMTRKDGKGKLPAKASSLGALTWTRAGASRGPIEPVAGLAVPQMPVNRAAGGIENELIAYGRERVLHNFGQMFG